MHQGLDVGRQLEEAEQIGDGRAVAADGLGDLRVTELELLAQAAVAGGLVDRRQVVALEILDQGQGEQRTIVHVPHDRRESWPSRAAGPRATAARRR